MGELHEQDCEARQHQSHCQSQRPPPPVQACAEAVYYSSLDHGPEHISSCQHYLELAQVFLALGPGHEDEAMACMDQVVAAWAVVLQAHVLGVGQVGGWAGGKAVGAKFLWCTLQSLGGAVWCMRWLVP